MSATQLLVKKPKILWVCMKHRKFLTHSDLKVHKCFLKSARKKMKLCKDGKKRLITRYKKCQNLRRIDNG